MIARLKQDKVLLIAWILAAISAFFVHPDAAYIEYIDLRVLALLFCLMVAVKGFQEIGVFDRLTGLLLSHTRDTRMLCAALVLLCFFPSMLITNDVALITFVPFAISALKACGEEKLLIRTIVLQTIAANLGSMATPVGNPQNLYLFSTSGMDIGAFFAAVLPYTALSLVLLAASMLLIEKQPVTTPAAEAKKPIPVPQTIMYAALFVFDLLVVFRVVPWQAALIVTIVVLLLGRSAVILKKVDYALLITFCGFFIFVGNLGRIPAVSTWLAGVISGHELPLAVLFSQALSNVPCALLMSGFTESWRALLLGVNIGGLGTLIASMASLISYKLYAAESGSQKGRYLGVFTVYNLVFLAVLMGAALIIH